MGQIQARVLLFGLSQVFILGSVLCSVGGSGAGFSAAPAHDVSDGDHHHHHCDREHHLHHHHHHHEANGAKLPEELAEEEDMRLYGFSNYHLHEHRDGHHSGDLKLSGFGLWLHAMGCSLLVSFASLICLTILPVIFIQGRPSKAIVDSLALFGAGAMLGDAFLHQLPHAFGGEHSHSHDPHGDHSHHAHVGHSHAHSLKDLSVGLSVLAGIVIFLLVEKLVRYVEDHSTGANAWGHGHHHHHQNSSKKLEDAGDHDEIQSQSVKGSGVKGSNEASDDPLIGNAAVQHESHLRKRNVTPDKNDSRTEDTANGSADVKSLDKTDSVQPPANLVFGYLNLFSDGVHNFTDGMALGSAFLLYGSVGGWSRTLFLLAHELPQEVQVLPSIN